MERVDVVTQPEGQALISENRNRAIDSLRQPRLRCVPALGHTRLEHLLIQG